MICPKGTDFDSALESTHCALMFTSDFFGEATATGAARRLMLGARTFDRSASV